MLCTQLITRREPYKGMQPLQVIAAVVFQGKRLPQPQKTDPRYVLSLPPPSSPVPSRPVPSCLPAAAAAAAVGHVGLPFSSPLAWLYSPCRLCALIDKCWAENADHRPSYATIQEILQGLFAESVQQAQRQPKVATTVIGKA